MLKIFPNVLKQVINVKRVILNHEIQLFLKQKLSYSSFFPCYLTCVKQSHLMSKSTGLEAHRPGLVLAV